MQRHLDYGRHKRAVERDIFIDKAAVGYAQKPKAQYQPHPQLRCSEQPPSMIDVLPQSWALKSSTFKRARFADKQRRFMADKFQQGESSGRKIGPASVARLMLTVSGEEDHEEALVGASQEAAIQELTNDVAREFLPARHVGWAEFV